MCVGRFGKDYVNEHATIFKNNYIPMTIFVLSIILFIYNAYLKIIGTGGH